MSTKYWRYDYIVWLEALPQTTRFMGPTWGQPGSCRPQMGPTLFPRTLLSGSVLCGCPREIRKRPNQIMNWCGQKTETVDSFRSRTLQWRHNGRGSVSNHQPHDWLLNRLFRRRSKKTSKLRVTGLCAGNSPGTGELPAQMASNAENVSIWWRHHEMVDLLLRACRWQLLWCNGYIT